MLTQVTRKLRSWGPVFDILPPNRVLALTVWFDPHDYYLCVCAKNWIQRVPSCWLACPLGDAAGYLGLSLPQAGRTPWPCWCLCPPPPASCLRKHRIILPLTAGVSSELWDAVFYTQLPIFSLYLVLSSVWWAASPWCLYSVILPCGPGSQGWSPAPWDLGRFSSFCLSFPFCTIGVVISVSPTEVKITVLFQTVECGSIMSHRNNLTIVLTKVMRLPWWLSRRNLPASAEDLGSVPGSGRPPEKEMATHSSVLTREITWTEEPGGLQSRGSQKSQTT